MTRTGKIALWLVIISCAFWALLLLLPFLKVSAGTKGVLAVIFIVAGEVTFWGGVLWVGRPVMKKYRHRLSPRRWFDRSHRP